MTPEIWRENIEKTPEIFYCQFITKAVRNCSQGLSCRFWQWKVSIFDKIMTKNRKKPIFRFFSGDCPTMVNLKYFVFTKLFLLFKITKTVVRKTFFVKLNFNVCLRKNDSFLLLSWANVAFFKFENSAWFLQILS